MAASWRRAVWFPKEDGTGQNQTPHPSLAIVGLILLIIMFNFHGFFGYSSPTSHHYQWILKRFLFFILTIQFKENVKFYFDISRNLQFFSYIVIQHWMVRYLDRGETRQSCWTEPLSLYHRNNSGRCVNKLSVDTKISTTCIGFKCTCACTMYNMYSWWI